MTTYHVPANNALAAPGSIRSTRLFALAVATATLALAGCESSNALFGSAAPQTQPETKIAQPAAPPPPAAPQTRVAIAPVIGAPDTVARQLQQEFGAAVAKQRATVVASGDKSDYTLRGYVVAAKDRVGTKVSYIWDVTDPTNKRVNRITGEEIVTGAASKDPWGAVTPAVMQTIAQKSATAFGAWLPPPTGGTAVQPAVASAAPTPTPTGVGASQAAPIATATTTPPRPATPLQPTPAAYQPAGVTAVVPSVAGAPGDGATALSQALQNELGKSGVATGTTSAASAYRVEGVVRIGAAREGQQSITIDWNVKDPQGKRLGTVSQKNQIAEGSLDGTWGQTANDAAVAAAQGIVKLLPARN